MKQWMQALGMGHYRPQGMHYRQQVAVNPHTSPGVDPIGGIDFPAANLHDPFGGNRESFRAGNIDPNQRAAMNWGQFLNPGMFGATYGNTPPSGSFGAPQGNTALPTYFNPQGFPYAVPNTPGGWNGAGYLPPGQETPWGSNVHQSGKH